MRYTRKDIAELLETVNGDPDVQGFGSSNFGGYSWNLVPSFGGSVWQNSSSQWTCEDGGQVTAENRSTYNCY